MRAYDVIVLGGGASGLMCALTAAARGRRVAVLDRSNKIGKKILMSGGGRCNFTNYFVEPDNYICDNPHFVKSALNQFTQWDFIAMVERYEIAYHERDHGQLFCNDSAKEILAMLVAECENNEVEIIVRCETETVSFNQQFFLNTSLGKFSAESLVVATGGLSIPTLGVSGFGYDVARQFGHEVKPVTAGLVPFTFSDWFKSVTETLSGTAMPAEVCCQQYCFTENILFTHRGLSGPAILQISNYWQTGDKVTVNLLPEDNAENFLLQMKSEKPRMSLKNILSSVLPAALVQELGHKFWPDWLTAVIADVPNKVLQQIAAHINCLEIKPAGTEGYRTAEVTRGGVSTQAISSKTMESSNQPGLYIIGEVLDVTGHLGGYNFQWAWASGFVAGNNA